jgi:hypothetical protein
MYYLLRLVLSEIDRWTWLHEPDQEVGASKGNNYLSCLGPKMWCDRAQVPWPALFRPRRLDVTAGTIRLQSPLQHVAAHEVYC